MIAQGEFQHGALFRIEALAKNVTPCREIGPHAHLRDFPREGMVLGIPQHAASELGVSRVPGINVLKADAEPLLRIGDTAPWVCIGKRIAFQREAGARGEQAPLIRKMCIERVPLHPCPLRHHAECRLRRPNAAVQIDRSLDDALSRFRLLLGAPLERVGPGHDNLTAQTCASIVDDPA